LLLRPSAVALAVATLLLCGFGWALLESNSVRPRPQRQIAAALVRDLGLTDLVLVTEARYLRHLSLADRNSAFQDHPAALEHFPSGAVLGVPKHLRAPDSPGGDQ
jgi:hypothetical protein